MATSEPLVPLRERGTIEERVIEMICETLCCYESDCTPNAELEADLQADSLDRVELTMAIEENLLGGSSIDETVALNWRTVSDVIETVRQMQPKPTRRKGDPK